MIDYYYISSNTLLLELESRIEIYLVTKPLKC